MDDGILAVISNMNIENEVKAELNKLNEPIMAHHCMYQAIGERMYISISRISQFVSKTALALTINADDTVTVDYLEYDAIFGREFIGHPLWNSISTVVMDKDGNAKRGFLRVETTVYTGGDASELALKADFRLSRTSPFYIHITDCDLGSPTAVFWQSAKVAFDRLETAWRT
jgi:hypothetical protein